MSPRVQQSTLCQSLADLASEKGAAPAYTELDGQGREVGRLSYSELALAVSRRAAGLQERGLQGERVILVLPSGLDLVVTLFACLWSGALPVVVMPPRREGSRQHLRRVIADGSPRLLVGAPQPGCELESLKPSELDGEPVAQLQVGLDDPALLQYTSGSTSDPRGVIVTHGNIMANLEIIRQVLWQPQGCTMVSWLPLYHDMGLVSKVLQAVHVGGHLVLMSPATFLWRPYLWLKAISDYRAHSSGAPNFAYQLAVEKIGPQERAGLDLSCWKSAFCAAEMVRPATVESFCQAFEPCGFDPAAFRPAYGLAEATLCVTCRQHPSCQPVFRVDRDLLEQGFARPSDVGTDLVSCGTPVAPTQVLILGAVGESPLPEGQVGEICVSGPAVTPGYWGRPSRHGPLRTGDLGFLWKGELFIAGRQKDLIIVDGRNLYPEDIEATVEACHPSIRSGGCAAFSLEREGRECLVIAIEARHADTATVERVVRQAVSEAHDAPVDHVLFLKPGGLSRTSSGKIQRGVCARALAELCRADEKGKDAPSLPDPVESYLCRRLAAELGVASLASTTPFDSMGVSSLLRFSLMGDLAQALGVAVPGDATWRYATPRAVARAIRQGLPRDLQMLQLGVGCPIVVLPDISGGLRWSEDIVAALPAHHNIVGLLEPATCQPTLEDLAAHGVSLLMERYGKGPFVLLGYSAMGRLAYEMGRQMEEAGAVVPVVAVIDETTDTPNNVTIRELWRQFRTRIVFRAWAVFKARGLAGFGKGLMAALTYLLKWARDRQRQARHEPEAVTPLPAGIDAFGQRVLLTRRYRATVSDLRMVVYRADSPSFSLLYSEGAGWGHLARGGVEVLDISASHKDIVRELHAVTIATDLSRRVCVSWTPSLPAGER